MSVYVVCFAHVCVYVRMYVYLHACVYAYANDLDPTINSEYFKAHTKVSQRDLTLIQYAPNMVSGGSLGASWEPL